MTENRKTELKKEYMQNECLIERCTKELADPRCSPEKIKVLTSMRKDMEDDNKEIIDILAMENVLTGLLA